VTSTLHNLKATLTIADISGKEKPLGADSLLGNVLAPGSVELIRTSFGASYIKWDLEPFRQMKFPSPAGMLDAFIRIADGDDQDTLRFAKRYGVLFLCRHGLPWPHYPSSPPRLPFIPGPQKGWWCKATQAEPVERWQFFARRAKAILGIAASLHRGNKPTKADWSAAIEGYKPAEAIVAFANRPLVTRKPPEIREHLILSSLVNEWLMIGGVKPALVWPPKGKPYFWLSSGTYGEIGVQIMTAVSRSGDLQICDGCGRPYLRTEKRPQRERRNYCESDSCKKIGNKLRQRERRNRLAKTKEATNG
jgi:hypothetical protein